MFESVKIKRMIKEELENYLTVIKTSFSTVAEDLNMTREDFPASGAYFDKNGFNKLLNKGVEFFGLYISHQEPDVLVGCIAISKKSNEKYKIMKLSILPEYRHCGYGGYLMAFAESYAIEGGGKVLTLGMVEENIALKKWYLERGYQINKISRYKKSDFNICFMGKSLEKLAVEEYKLENCYWCGQHLATCGCKKQLTFKTDVFIWLLTHEREKERPTNTGRLIKEVLPDNTEILYWSRVEPPKILLALMEDEAYFPILVFPDESKCREILTPKDIEEHSVVESNKKLAFIILDGTWKEARKILRKSPYLDKLPALALTDLEKTRYTLRRNKDEDHICTVEVALELLNICGEDTCAEGLNKYFEWFLETYEKQ